MTVQENIEKLGIEIPDVAMPAANYLTYKVSGEDVYVSGQLPIQAGTLKYVGKLGDNTTIETGYEAAKLCALNIVAQLNHALEGNLERVESCVKLGIFVNSTPDFHDHPKVGNGASDLIVEIFGDKGKHTRFAMGAGSLPFGAAVEIDAIFKIKI